MISRKEQIYTGVGILILIFFVYQIFFVGQQPEYPETRVLRYSFTVSNPGSSPLENANFWAYTALAQTANQERIAIRSSHPYKLQRDSDGNERMYFLLGTIAPYASKVINVGVEMRTTDTPNPITIPRLAKYIQAQRFVESDDDKIINLAEQLDAWRSSTAIHNVYEWVFSNLTYAGYLADDMGARYALESKSGDCSEYAYLVTALSRATGRNARVMAGFVVSGRNLLQPAEYHNWSEVYFGGTWHLVDAQRGSFDDNYSDYIGFRVVSSPTATDGKDFESQRLFGSGLPLLVRMNGRG